MDNQQYLAFLDPEKAKLNAAIPATRKLYLEFANAANAKFADYQKLLAELNDGIGQFFKAVDLSKYIDSNVSSSNIVKFMNEFLASFEIVLWQKIEAFGEATTEDLKRAASAEINGQKEAFEAGFGDATLAQLTAEKLISKETLSGITDRLMPLAGAKFLNPDYQAVIDGVTADNPIIFDAIRKVYFDKLVAEEAAKAQQKPAVHVKKQDPLIDAIKKLRKTQDTTHQKRKERLEKLLQESQSQISELMDNKDILRLTRAYIDQLKAGHNVGQVKKQIEGVSFQGAFYEIRHTCSQTWGRSDLSDLLYNFFTSVTGDYIAKDVVLRQHIEGLHSDYEAARKKMDQYPDITVTGILENSSNVLPLIFNEVYAHLTERKDYSHIEFANYVLERFVREFHVEVGRLVEQLIALEDGKRIKIDDLPVDDPNADQAVQLQAKQRLVLKEFDSAVEPYKARYDSLDKHDPLLLIKQQQIVIEFIEANEIIDRKKQQEVEKLHKEELKSLMEAPIKDIKLVVADQQKLLYEALGNLEKKLLKDIAAQKLPDQRLATLIDFYSKNPQAKIADILKNLQAEKNKAELIAKLEKDFKGSWLGSKLDELCKKADNNVDFESILKELMDMPQDVFLSNFFENKVQVIEQMPQLIQYIDSDIPANAAGSPPALIWKIVEQKIKEGMDPEEIVVVFDWDGTIVTQKPGAQALQVSVRWEEAMLKTLDDLKRTGVNLVIDTASKRSGIETITMKSKELGLLNFFGLRDLNNAANIDTFEKTAAGENILRWENIISGESDGYNKSGYLQEYMKLKKIKPKLVIFTDDGAVNLISMREYCANKDIQFVGIHVPQVDIAQPQHQKMLLMLKSHDENEESEIAEALDKEKGEPDQGSSALKVKREINAQPLPAWLR